MQFDNVLANDVLSTLLIEIELVDHFVRGKLSLAAVSVEEQVHSYHHLSVAFLAP